MTSVYYDQHSSGVPAMSAGLAGGQPQSNDRKSEPNGMRSQPNGNGVTATPRPTDPAMPTPGLSVERGTESGNGRLAAGVGKDVANAFKLLADETRLKILSFLVEEDELNVRSLCERLDQSQPAVSHHLALMRQAGLIASRRQGKNNFYRLIPQRMAEIRDLVEKLFLKDSDSYRAAM